MYLGEDGNIDAQPHARRLSRAGRAGHRARHGARAQAASASCRGTTSCCRRRIWPTKGFVMSASLAREPEQRVAAGQGRDAPVPRISRGVRQARRRRLGRDGDRIVLTDLGEEPAARSPTTGPTRSTRAGSPIASPKTWPRNGGLITKADLAAYQAKERAPIRASSSATRSSRCRRRARAASRWSRCSTSSRRPRFRRRRAARPRRCTSITEAHAARVSRSRALSRRSGLRRGAGREASSRSRTRATLAKTIDPKKASSSVELGKDIVTAAAAGRAGGDDAFLGRRQGRHGRLEHLHARRRLRLARRHQGHGHPAQQRDGRLQQEARHDEPHRRHRHRRQPHRAGQAHAELDDADDRRAQTASSCWSPDRPAAGRSSTPC